MELPGKRIQKWREYLGKSPKEFEALTGIPYSTLKTLENNTDPDKVKPSYDVLAKLRKGCPQLNIDWIFDEGDTEPMLKDGRTLTPATAAHSKPTDEARATAHPNIQPADKELAAGAPVGPTMFVNPAGTLEGHWKMIAEERAARLEDKDQEIARLMQQLEAWQEAFRKPLASAEAAAHLSSHRNPIGFATAASGQGQEVSMWLAA